MVSKAVAKVSLTAMMVTKNNDERMVKKSLQGLLYDVHKKASQRQVDYHFSGNVSTHVMLVKTCGKKSL